MSLPGYPHRVDSGDSLIGSVPAHWNRSALKRLATYQNGFAFKPEDWSDEGRPIIRIAQLTSSVEPNYFAGELDERLRVSTGDLLFSWSATIDSFIWRAGEAWLNQHIFKVSPTEEATKSYLFHLIKFLAPKLADLDAHGSTMRHIKKESLGQLVYVPPLDEQAAIAAFLDRETAKIDALIAEQEKLIALLAEKRQATISHAVTKGLDPNAPMKDSGVAWLGKVPAHWDVVPLKYLVELRSGGTPSKDNLDYWDGDVPWASAKDLKVERLGSTTDCITQKAVDDGAASLVRSAAVLVVVRGMILARTFPVVETLVPMAINQDLKAVLPLHRLNASYLAWLLRGSAEESLQRLDEAGHGTKALRMDAWTSMQLPIPPHGEQIEIAEFLSRETVRLDALCAEAERAIDLLKERRSALIAAAVTGQIDVRQA